MLTSRLLAATSALISVHIDVGYSELAGGVLVRDRECVDENHA